MRNTNRRDPRVMDDTAPNTGQMHETPQDIHKSVRFAEQAH